MKLFGRSAASAASGHSAEPEPCCAVSAETASVPNAVSPARLLAHSLTCCETRDEWERKPADMSSGVGFTIQYINKKRDLILTRWCAVYAGTGVTTPFELSKDEEKIVRDALDAFDNRKREEREAEALHRLTAPASGTPLRENNADCSRPKAGGPTRSKAKGDAKNKPNNGD